MSFSLGLAGYGVRAGQKPQEQALMLQKLRLIFTYPKMAVLHGSPLNREAVYNIKGK